MRLQILYFLIIRQHIQLNCIWNLNRIHILLLPRVQLLLLLFQWHFYFFLRHVVRYDYSTIHDNIPVGTSCEVISDVSVFGIDGFSLVGDNAIGLSEVVFLVGVDVVVFRNRSIIIILAHNWRWILV